MIVGAPKPEAWSEIHQQDRSWRAQLIGDINEVFVVPRYVELFYDTFGDARGEDFCEIGAGMGDLSAAVLAANRGQVRRYVTSERFQAGVDWLKDRGLEAVIADAERLPFRDAEFHNSVEFDVMHHVDNPRAMARELMRVAQKKVLLVESNGLSVFRKIKERAAHYRAAGERSYTPWQYRRFFEEHPGYRVTRFSIFPFLFPFKVPKPLLGPLVGFNQAIEEVPVLRWSCSSVAITVEFERVEVQRTTKDAEPEAWSASYHHPEESRRRRAKLPAKLAELGLDRADRSARVLDLCCGAGEALNALHEMGFRDLAGMDLSVPDALAKDRRFEIHRGDVRKLPFADASCDWVLLIHAMHHLETLEGVRTVLEEIRRVLKPGGRVGIIDFDGSWKTETVFWLFRQEKLLIAPPLERFGKLIQNEWSFLRHYLRQWPEIEILLYKNGWQVERIDPGLFHFRLTLRKP